MQFGPLRLAFLEHARHLDTAATETQKFDALCAMLNMPPGMGSTPPGDEEDARIKMGLRALSDKTRKIVGIIQYALLGRDYFHTNPDIYQSVVRKLVEDYVCDKADPDSAAAANMALYALTADLACVHPLALAATITYAHKLQSCKRDSHFMHDNLPNGDKAVNLMRLCVRAAKHHVHERRILIDDLLTIAGQKYAMVFLHAGQEALDHEVQRDAADPVMRRVQSALIRAGYAGGSFAGHDHVHGTRH